MDRTCRETGTVFFVIFHTAIFWFFYLPFWDFYINRCICVEYIGFLWFYQCQPCGVINRDIKWLLSNLWRYKILLCFFLCNIRWLKTKVKKYRTKKSKWYVLSLMRAEVHKLLGQEKWGLYIIYIRWYLKTQTPANPKTLVEG